MGWLFVCSFVCFWVSASLLPPCLLFRCGARSFACLILCLFVCLFVCLSVFIFLTLFVSFLDGRNGSASSGELNERR